MIDRKLLGTVPLLAALALLAAPAAPAPRATPEPALSEPATWLRDYLRIDTTTPRGEAAAASFLAEILHREGIETRLLVSPGGRTSLYARLEAPAPSAASAAEPVGKPGALVLLHHIDVVPPGPDWTVEPFDGVVSKGRLWGRGAIDIKSLGIAHLASFIDIRRRHLPLTRDVVFLAVADEERGGLQGSGSILEHHGDLLADTAAVLGEGGLNKTFDGRLLWAGIEIAQKRPLWLRASAHGRGGHGASAILSSAPQRLTEGLARVLELPQEPRVTEPARIYARALAPLHNPSVGKVLADLDDHVGPSGVDAGISPGIYNLLLDTVQLTVLRSGERINVIPEEATAELDVRLLPDTDGDAFLARIRDAAGPGVSFDVLLSAPPAPPSPVDSPIYRAVAGVLSEDGPVVPAFIPGFTDSRFFRERGTAAYGVSPFLLESHDFLGIHGPDESIPLAAFDRGVARMKKIVAACAVRGAAGP